MTRVWRFGMGEPVAPPEPAALILGGKGAGLLTMSRLGLPVPPGFVIATEVCDAYYTLHRSFPDGLKDEVAGALAALERATGHSFGDAANPLLVSVRSGAPASMPGMMDTILSVGLSKGAVAGLTARIGNLAGDSYLRLRETFVDMDLFLPQDADEQLWTAIQAVLDSWQSRRAVTYRDMHGLADKPGTAVTIQAMVFGNAGGDSATGVAFTRDPGTGAPAPFGEVLRNAQGEEVVGGTATPEPLDTLRASMPSIHVELSGHFRTLETHFAAMQEIEFTIERGKLWLLQTRTGVMSAEASARVAVDMVREGLIDRRRALERVDLAALRRPPVATVVAGAPLVRGLPASPGAVSGKVVFSSAEAEAAREASILVLPETRPQDVPGIRAAAGVLTSRGGATSHAAVIARGIGKPCVVGAGAMVVDGDAGRLTVGAREVRRGALLTIDGGTGCVFEGVQALHVPAPSDAVQTLLGWAAEAGA